MPTCATLWISFTYLNTIKEVKQFGRKASFFSYSTDFQQQFWYTYKSYKYNSGFISAFL